MTTQTEQMNWAKTEEHLIECEQAYAECGSVGGFALVTVINPVRDRFNSGERTRELHDEIWGIAL